MNRKNAITKLNAFLGTLNFSASEEREKHTHTTLWKAHFPPILEKHLLKSIVVSERRDGQSEYR